MIQWQAMALGALAVAGATGYFAWRTGDQMGFDRGLGAAAAKIRPVIQAKDAEIATLKIETAQAQAEVAKVNETTARQYAELQALMTSDQAKRDEASARVEKIAAEAAREAKQASQRALAAREVIQNVADTCARAGVPPDVLRVLNDILDGTDPVVRNGAMPTGAGAGRP